VSAGGHSIFPRTRCAHVQAIDLEPGSLGVGLHNQFALTLAKSWGVVPLLARSDFDFTLPLVGAVLMLHAQAIGSLGKGVRPTVGRALGDHPVILGVK